MFAAIAAGVPAWVGGQNPPPPAAATAPAAPAIGIADTTLIPSLDMPRAADAQIRVALFELIDDHAVAALSRLRAVVVPTSSTGPTAGLAAEPARQFLIAECLYRLGLDDQFRVAAEGVLAGPGATRFGAVLRAQLLFRAYRAGDMARALTLAKASTADQRSTLTAMLSGLVQYQTGDTAGARVSFAQAQQLAGTGPYAGYAKYLGVLAAVRTDSAHSSAVLITVDAALASASGEAANQLKLADAQIAYDARQYDRAATAAATVESGSASDPAARTTRAWSFTRGNHADSAGAAFGDLATRYPQVPQRYENRLMAAQSLLEQDRTGDARAAFTMIGDSAGVESQRITRWSTATHAPATSLVAARAVDVLFVPNVARGKTFGFPDSAGAGPATLDIAVASDASGRPPTFAEPYLLSVPMVTQRIDSVSGNAAANGIPLGDRDILRRAVFASEPATANGAAVRAAVARDHRGLREADATVALADAQVTAYHNNVALELMVLHRLRQSIEASGTSLGPEFATLALAEDSLARVTQNVDQAGVRLRRLFVPRLVGVRTLAAQNEYLIDSVRRSMGSLATSEDLAMLDRETEAAAEYSHVADVIDQGLGRAIANHPAFALRDTVRLLGERNRALIVQSQRAVATGEAAVDYEMVQAAEGDSARGPLRRTLAAAVTAQTNAAAALTISVERDLTARGTELAATVRRDQEAADFGAAGAAFFRQIANGGPNAAAAGGATGGTPGDAAEGDSAIAELQRVTARYPQSPARAGALYELGELLVRRADERYAAGQRALASGEAGRAGRPDVPAHPDYAPAIADYQELIKLYPLFPQLDGAAYTLGTLYATGARYADAAAMFEKVTQREGSPLRAEAWFRLGDARFELASAASGAKRQAMFGQAAAAYEQATATAPVTGDIYYLALYKLGWSYYSQASRQNPDGYTKANEVFGRLVDAYDQLPPDRQARLGLRDETLDYMAVSFTQVGGAAAMNQYFGGRVDASYKIPLLRRVAARLRDQGDFSRAVPAYQELLVEAPNDSSALSVQKEVIDIYQNRMLEPEKAQGARLALVDKFAPGFSWTVANQPLAKEAAVAREDALRQSAQYELAKAEASTSRQRGGTKAQADAGAAFSASSVGTITSAQRQHYAEAARLYGKYMTDYGTSDSARAVGTYYADALFGNGQYAQAGAQYARAAYGYPSDTGQAVAIAEQRAAQNAVVAYDSALAANKHDRGIQDSLFLMVKQYVERYPHTEVAKRALIEEGRRASEAGRWDVMAASFRQYATQYPTDPYAPTAAKLVGDALYKQGQYSAAQAQWDTAYVFAARTGHQALADSVKRIQTATASTYADSLVKAGSYQQAAQGVYVAYANANPTSEKAADALRDAIETYMLADSAARARGDEAASTEARSHAADLAKRLITEYPLYRYRIQYQTLYSDLLAETGKGNESIDALRRLIADNPGWHGRADAEIRLALRLDSLGRKKEAAAAYQQFATDYPQDKRASDALYNGALTYLEAKDTVAAAQAYGLFARRYPTDIRAGEARAFRVSLLKAAGDSAGVNADLAVLCASTPPANLKADCATRAGRAAFTSGVTQYRSYRPIKLVIASRSQLTAAGIKKASATKQQMLVALTKEFTLAIEAGDPEYLAAGDLLHRPGPMAIRQLPQGSPAAGFAERRRADRRRTGCGGAGRRVLRASTEDMAGPRGQGRPATDHESMGRHGARRCAWSGAQ